ncbi:MAG: alpha/beta hydrolase [Arenimonas sp.]
MSVHPPFCKIIFLTLLTSSKIFAVEASTKLIDDPVYTHAQRLVEIEPGRRLNLYCIGKGSPTVVFDSGLTDENVTWAMVQPVIAAHTRACSYDRAGSGYSDPGNRPGTSANIVDDLHRLLVAASIKPPYILVGHSFGGMNVRLYADVYLPEVAGMVLVDSTDEDWQQMAWRLDLQQQTHAEYTDNEKDLQSQRECIRAASSGFIQGSELYKRCIPEPDPHLSEAINAAYLKVHLSPGYQNAQLTEFANIYHASADQLRETRRWYGDIPLIVLAATPRGPRANESQIQRDALNRIWAAFYDQLAALSKRGFIRTVPNSDHNIQKSQPEAVSSAILEVFKAATEPKHE